MTQDYDMHNGDTTDYATVRPSEEVVRKIVDFARCYQTVDAGGIQVRFFLN